MVNLENASCRKKGNEMQSKLTQAGRKARVPDNNLELTAKPGFLEW